MARHESDREDLMREATALRRRVEAAVPGESEPIVAGFRGDGSLALYFGGDPVYQFDPQGRLRRAFVDGRLYRTQGQTLARLTRQRTPTVVELRRHDLTPDELTDLLRMMTHRLRRFQAALEQQAVVVVRQVPEDDAVLADVQDHIGRVLHTSDPLAPPIAGRR